MPPHRASASGVPPVTDRFSSRIDQVRAANEDTPDDGDYRACCAGHQDKRQATLCLRMADGSEEGVIYAYLMRWKYTPSAHLTLFFADMIYEIEGVNLGQVADEIRRQRATYLVCHNGRKHGPLPPGVAAITAIIARPPKPKN